jgi:hypothetical protein
MSLNREKLQDVLSRIGSALKRPTSICVIGSTPAILSGQKDRQTQDIDVWDPASSFDTADLSDACVAAGALFDPSGQLDPDDIYLQVVRPGVVNLPNKFETVDLATFGNLKVVMPSPAVIVAAKLIRSDDRDLADIAWWIGRQRLDEGTVRAAIRTLPNKFDRQTADENIILINFVSKRP